VSAVTEQFIRLGSVVLDRARNTPLRVVARDHRDAGEHPEVDVDDAMAQQWGITEFDDVYECVFLPTGEDAVSSPRKSYAYPASRLTRFPVEAALPDDARRIHTQIIIEFLAAILERAKTDKRADRRVGAIFEMVHQADFEAEIPPEVLLEEAEEFADASVGAGDRDE
jgi:hypothetical protein